MEQIAFFEEKKSCDNCKHYSALVTPRERPDGSVIYGYCFKNGEKNYSLNMGKGFPVFVSGTVCTAYIQRKKEGTP